jgi:hypothetical protein
MGFEALFSRPGRLIRLQKEFSVFFIKRRNEIGRYVLTAILVGFSFYFDTAFPNPLGLVEFAVTELMDQR